MTTETERHMQIAMIRESAGALGELDLGRIRGLRFTVPGFDRDVWRTMCALGWPGLRVPEARGGSGLGLAEICALAEELGRRLVPEPLIEAACIAGLLDDRRLAGVLSGELIVLPAAQEGPFAFSEEADAELRHGRVEGRKRFVLVAEGADAFLVSTPQGLAAVSRGEAGVTVTSAFAQDGTTVAEIVFAKAAGELVAPACARWREEAALATAAYLLGVAERAFEITLDYLRLREQFGRPIGGFQALQHRAADLALAIALTRSSVAAAARALDREADAFEQFAAVSRAKAGANDTALLVTREAVQMHGAIGYTDEHDIGLFLRKAMTLAGRYGSSREHRLRYMAAREARRAA